MIRVDRYLGCLGMAAMLMLTVWAAVVIGAGMQGLLP